METEITQFTEALKGLISEEDKAKILSVLAKYSKKKEAFITREEVKEEIESYLDGLIDEIRKINSEVEDFDQSMTLSNIFSNTMLFLVALAFSAKICSLCLESKSSSFVSHSHSNDIRFRG